MSDVRRPSLQSRRGLDAFAFFVANLQTGFGPFVSVYLTSQKWTQVDIGIVLTLGGIAGLVCQIPGGAVVDASHSKRTIAAVSLVLIGIAALALAMSAVFPVILFAWLLHSAASCTLGPSIASISLGLVGHRAIARRLGRNASFASLGSAVAAAAMGGFWLLCFEPSGVHRHGRPDGASPLRALSDSPWRDRRQSCDRRQAGRRIDDRARTGKRF